MKSSSLSLLLIALLLTATFAQQQGGDVKKMPKTDARSIAEAIQAGSWDIYVIYFYWKGEKENEKLQKGLKDEVLAKYKDAYYAEVDCSQSDYHVVLDLFQFADSRDNFTGRSVQLEELPMVLAIVHGVGYVSHGETSYKLIAQNMPELVDYSKRKSVQRAY